MNKGKFCIFKLHVGPEITRRGMYSKIKINSLRDSVVLKSKGVEK